MTQKLSILLAQINPTVGAITANCEKIIDIIQTHQRNHDLIIFPELALSGYPPEDLLFRDNFFSQINQSLEKIQKITKNCHVIVGHPTNEGNERYNSASLFSNGSRILQYHKQNLPNYGVFDEKRYFSAGPSNAPVFSIGHYRFGLCICEDLWSKGPVDLLIDKNVNAIICINASPFDENKYMLRESLLRTFATRGVALIYVNQIGGQDDLVFDGQSLALDNHGQICARLPAFIEHLQTLSLKADKLSSEISPLLGHDALIYQALVCGLRDYVEKNKFPGVLLGLSGGIDSALCLCIAVDALGASRVQAVLMPSRYTACMSNEDAKEQAVTMGVRYITLPIEPAFKVLLKTLAPSFEGLKPDITEENLQARIRGTLLMALSNKTGMMLLSTSNKSETAVGYSTLYGDMAGGFAVLKDVLKTTAYALSYYRNTSSSVIPIRTLTRAPSAELAKNQTDQDSLPDYAILDGIIREYMDNNLDAEAIIREGYLPQDVLKVIRLIKRNEYKRHQAPPGVKITTCAFGRDWRYPMTSGFTE